MVDIKNILPKRFQNAILSLALFTLFSACEFFEKEEHLLAQHQRKNGTIIKIYYVGLGATTNDVIQVRQPIGNSESIVASIEKYNFLNASNLNGDSVLLLILSDTMYPSNKPDTIKVNIRK